MYIYMGTRSPGGKSHTGSGVRLLIMKWTVFCMVLFFNGCFFFAVLQYKISTESEALDIQLNTDYSCSDRICFNLLSRTEKELYSKCYNKTILPKTARKFGAITNGNCHFQNGKGRYSVGLGSFQGSGNTWLRGLLERATGICTGSLYCDGALRTKGFTGEGTHGPSVIAIKSHSINPLFTHMKKLPKIVPMKVPVFGAAVLLIRNPRNALIAEWHRERTKRQSNRNISNHFLYVGEEFFGYNSDWNRYVLRMAERWKRHTCGWLINGKNNPLHIVRYEDLKDGTTKEVLKVVQFLGGVNLPDHNITERLKPGYNHFYRNHVDTFFHFTPDQEAYISGVIHTTISNLRNHFSNDSLIIKYLSLYISR